MRMIEICEHLDLFESSEAATAINAIRATIGNPIQLLYREIKATADKFSNTNPEMKGFAKIAGAAKTRWLDKFGVQLKSDIRKLAENLPPKSARILKDALLQRPAKYSEFLSVFVPALGEVGRRVNSAALKDAAESWQLADKRLAQYVESLVDSGVDLRRPAATQSAPKKQSTAGSQNQSAEQLISTVIASIPDKYKHEVRTKVAKSQNKLLTLQQELDRLGIKS